MAHGKEKVVIGEMNMGSAVYGTIVPANGTLYLNNRSQLFAISGATKWPASKLERTMALLMGSHAAAACPRSRQASRCPLAARRTGVARTRLRQRLAAVPRHANLTGVSASTPPATLKVLWTYDTKDVIDSSAAIVDGVVYVGGGNGDLLALDLASGKLRWKYTTGNLIGESLAGRRRRGRTSAISAACCTP